MRKMRGFAAVGSTSLIAMSLLLAPALAETSQHQRTARPSPVLNGRPVGAFTPAVADPRLAAVLARSGTRISSDFRFTPDRKSVV